MQKFVRESWLVLLLGTVFAMLLAGAQYQFKPLIADNEAGVLRVGIVEVVPDMDATRPTELLEADGNKVFRCFASDGTVAGYAVEASGPGFVDRITVVIGLAPELDRLLGVRVLRHSETPGLGTKIEHTYDFPKQFPGKPVDANLVVEKRPARAPHEIQAITGATWSSVYVTEIVNDVNRRVVPALRRQLAEGSE